MSSYLVKCASCGTLNRFPEEKEGVPGQCGNCRARLPALYHRPKQLNDANFDAFLASYPGPVLVEFWAPW